MNQRKLFLSVLIMLLGAGVMGLQAQLSISPSSFSFTVDQGDTDSRCGRQHDVLPTAAAALKHRPDIVERRDHTGHRSEKS